MKTINRICIVIIALIVCAFLCFNLVVRRIEIGRIGVRTQQYTIPLFGKAGVVQKDFEAGWHRSLPFIDRWDIFDSTLQTMEFATEAERTKTRSWRDSFRSVTDSMGMDEGIDRVDLRTADGFRVLLDITVKYRVAPGKVHNLRKDSGSESIYKQFVRAEAINIFRSVFQKMRTGQFYNPQTRRKMTVECYETLSKRLEPRFIEIVDILIRDITFGEAYEQKILDKKLADQEVQLNKSKALAEEKRGLTNKIKAETEAKVLVIDEERKARLVTMQAEMDKTIAQITAEAKVKSATAHAGADLYGKQKVAEGYLLEKKAEAEGERLKAQALQGSGAANLVAIEAVRGLNLGDVRLSTLDVDLLDVEGMSKKLGARKDGDRDGKVQAAPEERESALSDASEPTQPTANAESAKPAEPAPAPETPVAMPAAPPRPATEPATKAQE